ncbi:MAG: NADH-quinone oxidoreductase subunit A [Aquificae bacterium]|nr:NADH-quinone oxidoreductase subunit A [Aquificota bacterium]
MLAAFIVFVVALLVTAVLFWLIALLYAPKGDSVAKHIPYECAVPPEGPLPKKSNFRYYFFGILFLTMDMVGMFLALKALTNGQGIWIYLLFVIPLLIAILHIIGGRRYVDQVS